MEIFILLLIFSFSFSESFKTFQNSKYSYRILEEDFTYLTESEGKKFLKEPKGTKPTLVDFGNFKRKNSNEDKGLNIVFTLYFKNVAPSIRESIFLDYIYFIANITTRKKTERLLEDSKENEPPLLMGVLEYYTLSKDIVEYKVNKTFDNIIEQYFLSLEIIPKFQIVDSKCINPSLIIDELESGSSDIEIRSSLNTKNVENYTAPSEYNPLYFKIYDINHLGFLHYKVIGFFEKNLSLDKANLTFHYEQYGEERTFQGIFERTSDPSDTSPRCNYTLTFRLKDFINADLGRDCWANITEYNIKKVRRLQEDIYKEINLFAEKVNILNLDESEPEHLNYFSRKVNSSSGLSGGAIAGIVICCVVALIAVTFAIIYFKKLGNKTYGTNAIEFYNNDKSNVNSSVNIVQ